MEAMEIDVPKQEDLFRAAEKGDAALFSSLGEEALHRARSMRNEDGRSLLHVAASSGHPEASYRARWFISRIWSDLFRNYASGV
ncbi:putative Ankyrin repeat family protein [Cocos nucifera]|uniref:Putative Ankyrin repeat family protein n=1 Tax=Cocos nucifera TaxID=13894 RepID=A0A8K0NCV8_COCNU|nr:putative Ankyrin repeat family protein [Cocos nucifera]